MAPPPMLKPARLACRSINDVARPARSFAVTRSRPKPAETNGRRNYSVYFRGAVTTIFPISAVERLERMNWLWSF